MEKRLYCVRGATCADNTKQSIMVNVCEMMDSLVELNNLKTEDIVSIQFTMTPDLDELNPARALRLGGSRINGSVIPLFTSQEAIEKGMLEHVVRVMITAYLPEGSVLKPVYINGAQKLRPDLIKE